MLEWVFGWVFKFFFFLHYAVFYLQFPPPLFTVVERNLKSIALLDVVYPSLLGCLKNV